MNILIKDGLCDEIFVEKKEAGGSTNKKQNTGGVCVCVCVVVVLVMCFSPQF
jgi:hypothetical protein